MDDPLYNRDILRLAAATAAPERLPAPDITVVRDSLTCGSRITVDLTVDGDRVTGYGHAIQACAIGQAAAAMVGRNAPGQTFEQISDFRDAMYRMLSSGELANGPDDWPELPVFAVVHHHPARHEASLLALDAILEARDRLAAS
ncbi:MAG: iron-sulfur cluster assembly scaffold protein [Pseudomonadota bacterium]